MRQVFSLRAQTRADIDRFLAAARSCGADFSNVQVHPDARAPGAELEFTTDMGREQLDDLLTDTLSTGLMRRTLRPVSREDNCMTFGPTLAMAC